MTLHGSHCYWCQHTVNRHAPPGSPDRPTREHLLAKSRGGKGADNIVTACSSCNGMRGNAPVSVFRSWLKTSEGHAWKQARPRDRSARRRAFMAYQRVTSRDEARRHVAGIDADCGRPR